MRRGPRRWLEGFTGRGASPGPGRGTERRVLFYRDFRYFTGGHLKVWHYFDHVRRTPGFTPLIACAPETRWDAMNPWLGMRDQVLPRWDPEAADILFLAGMDWSVLAERERRAPPRPVINLIQHVRHADPAEPLYQFLSHPAIRVCVSEPVTAALRATGRVVGPLVTIPNGIDTGDLPAARPWVGRDPGILILGIKQPALALELQARLLRAGRAVDCLVAAVPRGEFLARLAQARLALLLPNPTEGFYLPALEAFALETLVVCPDCIGNRSFCVAGANCWQPPYRLEALLAAVDQALALPAEGVQAVLAAGRATAQRHGLDQERQAFAQLLQSLATEGNR